MAEFRRLEERTSGRVGPVTGALGGLAMGPITTLGMFLVELGLCRAAGIATPSGSMLPPMLLAVGAVGGLLGVANGITGLWGASFTLALVVSLFGWVGGAAMFAGTAGITPVVGVAGVTLVAFVIGQAAARLPAPAWLTAGLSGTGFVFLALAAPVNLHLLPSSTDVVAIAIDCTLLLVAASLGGVEAALGGEGRPPFVAFGLIAGAGAAGLVLIGPADPTPPPAEGDGPVLLIVDITGLRADMLPPSAGRAVTPNLDGFAAKSVRFDQARASSSWSVPSIATLFTGRRPYSHLAGANDGSGPTQWPLRPDFPTLALSLGKAGFSRAAVTGDASLRTFQLHAGFDSWDDRLPNGALPALLAPAVVAGLDLGMFVLRTPAATVTDRALAVLSSRAPGKGMLLFVQYADLAGPFVYPHADLVHTTRAGVLDEYDAALTGLDRELGRLLAAVPSDAWVVVTSDHGVQLGENRAQPTPFRSGHSVYDEVVHVPLLLRAPSLAPRRAPEAVGLIDLAPTLLEAVGAPPLKVVDGEVLRRAFGEVGASHPVLIQSMRHGAERQAVVDWPYKLHSSAGSQPLFELAADPSEVSPLREGGLTDTTRRQMLGLLPPPGSGVRLDDPPPAILRIGRVATWFRR